MTMAFIFINVEPGSESDVLENLRGFAEVKESYFVYGVYDLVAKVEAESVDRLKEVVTWKIRRLDKVKSTLTTIIMDEN